MKVGNVFLTERGGRRLGGQRARRRRTYPLAWAEVAPRTAY